MIINAKKQNFMKKISIFALLCIAMSCTLQERRKFANAKQGKGRPGHKNPRQALDLTGK